MKIYNLDEEFPQSSIDKISETKNLEVDKALSEIKDRDNFEKICRETREMIPQIDGRIHYWEERRTTFLQISLGVLAASLAGIVAIASEAQVSIKSFYNAENFLYIPIFVVSIVLVIGCIGILNLWNKQNNPVYPFTKATKTWRWQYRHSETIPNRTDFESFTPEITEKEAYIFANNLADYKLKTLTSNDKELLDQDLSQLYLLMINEKFKIKFVSKLRDQLFNILKISLIALVITLVILIILFVGNYGLNIQIIWLPK